MSPTLQPKKRSIWKRLLLGMIVIAALFVGYHYWVVSNYEQELAVLLAQINAEDPNWTWEQRLAARNALKPEDNGGIELTELLKLTTLRETIPMGSRNEWAIKYRESYQKDAMLHYDSFLEQHPNARLPIQIREITEPLLKMEPMPEALSRARNMKRYQDGRIDHTYRTLLMLSLLPDAQGTREISRLLAYDSDLLTEQKQVEPVIESIQGMLGIARILSNDPFVITLFVRNAIVGQACRQTNRLLAQSVQLASEQLKVLQAEFDREHALTNGLLTEMIRCERALLDHDLEQLAQGKVNFSDIASTLGLKLKFSTGYVPLDQKLVDLFPEMLFGWGNRPGHYKQERAMLLKFFNEAVRWGKMQEHTLIPALGTWKTTGPFITPFQRQFHSMFPGDRRDAIPEIDALSGMAYTNLNCRARLRAIIAAIACERYRLDTKSWPTSWEQLIPLYQKTIPIDPYTGKPLFLKPRPDGLVIYSVGRDGKDDNGDVLPGESSAKDLGYRLWNLPQRGINLDEKYTEYLRQMNQE